MATARGIAGFTAEILVENQGMLRAFHKCGYAVESEFAHGVYRLRIPFAARKPKRAREQPAQ